LAKKSAHFREARGPDSPADKLAADAVDRAYLARFTLGNGALEREVLELFAAQAPTYLQRLREARCKKAWKEAAHTIKGSASAIGAWRLARFAEMAEKIDVEAEMALREGHGDEAVVAVATATEEVCRYIARLFPAT
jgi:HPt (histidine-containing phosphotransfer) domain-containing protein